jgi:hypothetical protein
VPRTDQISPRLKTLRSADWLIKDLRDRIDFVFLPARPLSRPF